jgi:peptidoglycan LD-endopeptidase LytH
VRDRELRRSLRVFAIGVACGFIIGAALVSILITKYGQIAAVHSSTARMTADDGLADLDSPVIQVRPSGANTPVATTGSAGPVVAAAPADLTGRDFEMPVEGVKSDQLVRSFADSRTGSRAHEAIDILAPRNTPVKAVEDGTIARLFESKAGGTTIYQFDPTEQYCYYYAHLERYAEGLREGEKVRKGQVIGYVGTSGNAPKNTPHLHFAIFRLTDAKHWWEGTPIDPYDVLH